MLVFYSGGYYLSRSTGKYVDGLGETVFLLNQDKKVIGTVAEEDVMVIFPGDEGYEYGMRKVLRS